MPFQLIVLGGKGAMHGVLNGETFRTDVVPATAVRDEGYKAFFKEDLAGDQPACSICAPCARSPTIARPDN